MINCTCSTGRLFSTNTKQRRASYVENQENREEKEANQPMRKEGASNQMKMPDFRMNTLYRERWREHTSLLAEGAPAQL